MAFNQEHGIEPRTVRKAISDIMQFIQDEDDDMGASVDKVNDELANMAREEVLRIIANLEEEMAEASHKLDFEAAARLRDRVVALRSKVEQRSEDEVLANLKSNSRKGSSYGRSRRR